MIFPDHRESPEPWDPEEDSREYRLRQQYQASAARREAERIRASNAEKMERLRARIDSGEWQQRDPVARALGLGGRPRDHLDDLIDQMDNPVTRYEHGQARARAALGLPPLLNTPRAVLDWLDSHRTYHAGPA